MGIERKYIVDEFDRRIAVQLDIETFEKIEDTMENFGLVAFMRADEPDDEILGIEQAISYYRIVAFAFEQLPLATSIAELKVIEKTQ